MRTILHTVFSLEKTPLVFPILLLMSSCISILADDASEICEAVDALEAFVADIDGYLQFFGDAQHLCLFCANLQSHVASMLSQRRGFIAHVLFCAR
jgi:hypothetical protein